MQVVTNGHFAGATRVTVRDVEYFRAADGRTYRDAHPMQRAAVIYQPKTPGLARVRMILLDPVSEDVAAALAKHDDALATVNGAPKLVSCGAVGESSKKTAPKARPMRAVPKAAQIARKGAKAKKPVRGLTK